MLTKQDHHLCEDTIVTMIFPDNIPAPPNKLKRNVMPPESTVLFLSWKNPDQPVDMTLRRQPYLRHLMIQCDGSGGEAWGVGVFIPSLEKREAIGGAHAGMDHLMVHGSFDSALVETFALAYGLHVASEKLRLSSDLRDSYDAVLILIDNTNVVAGKFVNKQAEPRIEAALTHVIRYASKVLMQEKAIKVVHKRVYGLGKNWEPDRLAANYKKQGLAWKDTAKPPECPVSFANPRYGCLRESGPEILLEFDII